MDYEIHINGGSADIEPITLYLLPGEETLFDLRVVNDGEPSNIYLETNGPLKKVVRIREADHYLAREKVVPILVRMPDDIDRLEGYLSVVGEDTILKVPFSLIRDDDGGEDAPQALEATDEQAGRVVDVSDDPEPEDADEAYGSDNDQGSEYVPCYLDAPEDEDGEEGGGLDPHESQRPSYTARSRALRAKRIAYRNGHDDDIDRDGRSTDSYSQDGYEDSETPRDGRGRSLGHRRGESTDGKRESKEGFVEASESQYHSKYQDSYYEPPEDKLSLITLSLGYGGLLLTVPSILFISLIASLVLTFYASAVPELLGALVSSILIVTLIIYGAATLLKA